MIRYIGTIKKIEKGKKKRKKWNKPSAEGASELRSAEAASPLANIFGNDTIYRHNKKNEKGKKKPRNKLNKPSAGRTRTGRNRAKDFAKV